MVMELCRGNLSSVMLLHSGKASPLPLREVLRVSECLQAEATKGTYAMASPAFSGFLLMATFTIPCQARS